MAGSSATFHESPDELSRATRDRHRAVASLVEELEAVDWYDQRIDAADDDELAEILAHNRDEEKEHAAMVLEWLRRRDPGWDEYLRRYLFTDGPLTGRSGGDGGESHGGSEPAASLRIGGLRDKEAL